MKILKSRRVAAVITVAVCALSLALGARRSVKQQYNRVARLFVEGVYIAENNYTEPPMYGIIQERAAAAQGIVSVCELYDELSGKTGEMQRLCRELSWERDPVAAMNLNDEMTLYADMLRRDIEESGAALTDDERGMLGDYYTQFDGNGAFFEKSRFVARYDEFCRMTKKFPLTLFGARIPIPYSYGAYYP
jgi:hypothetical protein